MKLILFAAAARLAHGADFCVPAACRKLAPGADGFMKDLVGDLPRCDSPTTVTTPLLDIAPPLYTVRFYPTPRVVVAAFD